MYSQVLDILMVLSIHFFKLVLLVLQDVLMVENWLFVPGDEQHLSDAERECEALPERGRPHDPGGLAVVVHEAQHRNHPAEDGVAEIGRDKVFR